METAEVSRLRETNRSQSSVLRCWWINVNLPHIMLMLRGFWQRHFSVISKTRNGDETGGRVWEKAGESKQRQNDNKIVARPEKEKAEDYCWSSQWVRASSAARLWTLFVQLPRPERALSSFARTRFFWLGLVTCGEITHRLCWLRESPAIGRLPKVTDAKSRVITLSACLRNTDMACTENTELLFHHCEKHAWHDWHCAADSRNPDWSELVLRDTAAED